MQMWPLLAVALIVWLGIFAFVFMLDRKVSALERDVERALRKEEK